MNPIDDTHQFILKGSPVQSENCTNEYDSAPDYILQSLEKQSFAKSGNRIWNGVSGLQTLYSEFEILSRRVGSALWRRGFRKGDTLIYTSDDPSRLHVFLLGVWRANGILRGSYPEDLGDSLLTRIEESESSWVLCDEENANAVLSCCDKVGWKINIIVFGSSSSTCPTNCIPADSFFEDDGEECPVLELKGEDVAAVLPTSGTTGKSKGVVLTHGRLLVNLISVKDSAAVLEKRNQSSTLLHLGKSTHVSALINFLFIANGRNLVRLRTKDYTPEIIAATINKYRPSEMTINGLLMQKVVNCAVAPQDLQSLKLVNLIGTTVPESLISKIKNLPSSPRVCLLYGSTETLSLCYGDTSLMSDGISIGATGKLVSGVSMAVRDEEGNILGPNEKGELWFKSGHSCLGYFKNPIETENTFQNDWIRTGDLGYYDAQGFVYIVGRLKEVFKYCGNHVSISEIEEILIGHPDVAEACVIGIPAGDELGQIPKAFVIVRTVAEVPDAEDVINYANARLPSYMHLRGGLEFVDKFIYGPGGKIQRHLLNSTT